MCGFLIISEVELFLMFISLSCFLLYTCQFISFAYILVFFLTDL